MTKHQRFENLMRDLTERLGIPDHGDEELVKEVFDLGYEAAIEDAAVLIENDDWKRKHRDCDNCNRPTVYEAADAIRALLTEEADG